VSGESAPPRDDPLAPLIRALLDDAHREARAALDRADADAGTVLDAARSEAAEILAQARARGESDGRAALAQRRAQAQRQAAQLLLDAQRTAAENLRRAARTAVSGLVTDPHYPAVRDALAARARRLLGPDARITALDEGGVVARAGSRQVTYRLADLADDVLDQLDVGTGESWA
jgi:vacuolar-type H+-ATPase subunit E/Vma4